ncbi:beta-lactamase family protein [Clostridium estertheticum]|uniref:serine hydrolase domain-containing protein n=1 Tax=Clostridium estertheticum TaxID=238834 RepID=UPI001C0CAC1E|nr:serine hydrolase domain-containing protein [Clostridium estertheticum]MBU3198531.1 beta-lactamase family protein [Clostridium estertheticum]WAG64511.1 beta-lactamase family protein [Clostridium estertheticum]
MNNKMFYMKTTAFTTEHPVKNSELSEKEIKVIEGIIKEQMKVAKFPGVAVTIIKDNTQVYNKGFGYSDKSKKIPVNTKTLFEIGSTSKAFTGLVILLLQEQRLIDLKDNVKKYLPWFKMYYEGKEVNITIEELLYQTSGIPFNTLGYIPEGNEKDKLEKTVETLVGKELQSIPGEKFSYATINYDVLGLIIEKISGQSFENYVKVNILHKIGLTNTYLSREEAERHNMSLGYKLSFLRTIEYNAPIYRGNLPAGYFITNIDDVSRWLKIQVNPESMSYPYKSIIEKSHIPNRTVMPNTNGSSYATGWYVFRKGTGELSHGGSNPNYSSYFVFKPNEKLAVGVLANLNSTYIQNIGQGIIDALDGSKTTKISSDIYKSVDTIAFAIMCISIPFTSLTLFFMFTAIVEIINNKRNLPENVKKYFCSILIILAFTGLLIFSIYKLLPSIAFNNLPWNSVLVWAPSSFKYAIISSVVTIILFIIFIMITFVFPKVNNKYFFIVFYNNIVNFI